MRIGTEHIYELVKKYGGVLTDDRHFMDDVDKILETAHNSDYAKCKSIGCQFYDETMECNCCANEDLCEKCMNSQHFAYSRNVR